jgi:hypothetical protein
MGEGKSWASAQLAGPSPAFGLHWEASEEPSTPVTKENSSKGSGHGMGTVRGRDTAGGSLTRRAQPTGFNSERPQGCH